MNSDINFRAFNRIIGGAVVHRRRERKFYTVPFANGIGNASVTQDKRVLAIRAHNQLTKIVGCAGSVRGAVGGCPVGSIGIGRGVVGGGYIHGGAAGLRASCVHQAVGQVTGVAVVYIGGKDLTRGNKLMMGGVCQSIGRIHPLAVRVGCIGRVFCSVQRIGYAFVVGIGIHTTFFYIDTVASGAEHGGVIGPLDGH